jgi:hypothetical protein
MLYEQATLFLLKDRLDRIRKSKRNGIIAIWVCVIVAGLIWNVVYEFDFWIGFILVVARAKSLIVLQ